MTDFGNLLREAREANSVSIETVASATRIAERYLRALERSDLDALPGAVFDKGYIRSYAEFVGIDAEPVVAAYAAAARRRGRGTPEHERQKLEELSRLVAQRSAAGRRGAVIEPKHVLAALVVAGVVLVAAVMWLMLRNSSPSVEPDTVSEPVSSTRQVVRSLSTTTSARPESSDEAASLPLANPSEIRVTQSAVGSDVVDRALVGETDRFPDGARVWFWTRVQGGESGERIYHIWMHDGQTHMRANLRVGGSHWRTYSTLVLPPGTAGDWVVEARAADGTILSRETFHSIPRDGT